MPGTGNYWSAQDPRPDIWWDSVLWVAVLAAALSYDECKGNDSNIAGLLHGLRCGGAQLRWSGPHNRLRLDYTSLTSGGEWSEEELRRNWLIPVAADLKAVFGIVEMQAHITRADMDLPMAVGL